VAYPIAIFGVLGVKEEEEGEEDDKEAEEEPAEEEAETYPLFSRLEMIFLSSSLLNI
jgi:hypothetical protein